MNSKEKYLQEYEKYKNVQLDEQSTYVKKSRSSEKVVLLEIDTKKETALVKNLRTDNIQSKTLHWCRKNLFKIED
jgi:ribosomal protein L25 (general stress protein Ctc)